VHFDKVISRIGKLCYALDPVVDPIVLSQKVVQGIYPGVSTRELDELASQTAAALSTQHPDFAKLAARIR
jgi:ATP cone domain